GGSALGGERAPRLAGRLDGDERDAQGDQHEGGNRSLQKEKGCQRPEGEPRHAARPLRPSRRLRRRERDHRGGGDRLRHLERDGLDRDREVVQEDAAGDGFGVVALEDLGWEATGRTGIDGEIRHGDSPLKGSGRCWPLGLILPRLSLLMIGRRRRKYEGVKPISSFSSLSSVVLRSRKPRRLS